MNIIADTHCHTVASGHAYSTVLENIKVAKKKNLLAIAITDHTGNIPGAPGSWFFDNLRILPPEIYGIKILKGIECNILDETGKIDLPEDLRFDLDWVIASIHESIFLKKGDKNACSNAYINVAKNTKVKVIGHSGSPGFEYDFEKVIPIFKQYKKLVEINASSPRVREGSKNNCIEIAKICKKYEVPVIVNSDSHFCDHVGRFDLALDLLDSINFPEELVVNSNLKSFEKYL